MINCTVGMFSIAQSIQQEMNACSSIVSVGAKYALRGVEPGNGEYLASLTRSKTSAVSTVVEGHLPTSTTNSDIH